MPSEQDGLADHAAVGHAAERARGIFETRHFSDRRRAPALLPQRGDVLLRTSNEVGQAITRSPTRNSALRLPTALTIPATSLPGLKGSGARI
ncbi:MAG: hypothetical protein ABSE67_18240 [Xanthobacteraceae bacterium]|jgi:hypothetical protein